MRADVEKLEKVLREAKICVHSLGASSLAATIFLDTFQTNAVGNPDIGFYNQFDGTHAAVDLGGGDKRLRSTDNATDDGFAIDSTHNMQPFVPFARTSYDIRIESGVTLVGANAFIQEAILDPLVNNLFLFWGDDKRLWVTKSLGSGRGTFDVLAQALMAWARSGGRSPLCEAVEP